MKDARPQLVRPTQGWEAYIVWPSFRLLVGGQVRDQGETLNGCIGCQRRAGMRGRSGLLRTVQECAPQPAGAQLDSPRILVAAGTRHQRDTVPFLLADPAAKGTGA